MTFNDYGVKNICKVFFLQKNGHTICKNVLAKFGSFLAFGNEKTDFFFFLRKKATFPSLVEIKHPTSTLDGKKHGLKKAEHF